MISTYGKILSAIEKTLWVLSEEPDKSSCT